MARRIGIALALALAAFVFLLDLDAWRFQFHPHSVLTPAGGRWDAIVYRQRTAWLGSGARVAIRIHCGKVIARLRLVGETTRWGHLDRPEAFILMDDERVEIGPGWLLGLGTESFELTYQEVCVDKGWG